MSKTVTEWEFVADAASRMNEIIQANGPALPFARAKVEQRALGTRKRRDLTIVNTKGQAILTGEVKMPWASDGHSPFVDSVVRDARKKAERAKSPWFFTWNVNELVLWRTDDKDASGRERHFKRYQVATVGKPVDFNNEFIAQGLRDGIGDILFDFARIVSGVEELGRHAPDDYFIESLESFLERPIHTTFLELMARSTKPAQREQLHQWMLRDQGWTLVEDEAENFRRASQFATYAVVNKLVFYEALRKRFPGLKVLRIPRHLNTGEGALAHLESFFGKARDLTGDYETVFGVDSADFGTRIPFYADDGVSSWRSLVDHIDRFDFSTLDYDVIGRIFERLIAPEERHKYGQYYTRPEVVDLINSFCIRHGSSSVLDPACGGGTFLVRAYARKRKMASHLGHAQLISGLYGVDISHFAAHLTTINLAARDLIDAENYPRIVREDFFNLSSGATFMTLPRHKARVRGLGKTTTTIALDQVDAIVANPPYVRQEDIRRDKNGNKKAPRAGTKEFCSDLVARETGVRPSGRSDLHCYFWGHASSFLRPEGWLGFLTSSQWLDAEYGFKLQGWLLDNFRIVAIIESRVEPWFVGTRVATAITIAKRESNQRERDSNLVRFVELRVPLATFMRGDGTSYGMIDAADGFRERLMATNRDTVTATHRVRLVRQGDLRSEGVALSRLMPNTSARDDDSDEDKTEQNGLADKYFGGKWGLYVRAPDIWFELVDRTKSRWERLGLLASVRFGLKTGADDFFYVRDVTAATLSAFPDSREFARHYGVGRREVERGLFKLVQSGTGEVWPIEAEYLQPELHSLMEVDGFTVSESNCSRLVLLVGKTRRELRGRYVDRYIEWGKEQKLDRRPTCAGRASEGDPERGIPPRDWYDLTGSSRGKLFWMKSSQYKHVVPTNDHNLICNCNLYDVFPNDSIDAECLAGILNSTIVVLAKHQFGRPAGVEGNLKTEVIDVNMMLIPNPLQGSSKAVARVMAAFRAMKHRKVLGFLSERRLRQMALSQKGNDAALSRLSDETELDQPDRHELDDAVLELLGVKGAAERSSLRVEIYDCLRQHYESIRRKEEEAILNKKRAKRVARLTPDEIADSVFSNIKEQYPTLSRRYDDLLTDDIVDRSEGLAIPANGRPEVVADMVTTGVRFATGKGKGKLVNARNREQAELIALVAEAEGLGRHEFFPIDAKECAKLHTQFSRHFMARRDRVTQLVKERTADPDLQEELIEKVLQRFLLKQRS